jgi:signal transduction histidine kinase
MAEPELLDALPSGATAVIELIARGAPLREILERLVLVMEGQSAGLLGSILRVDGEGRVHDLAGPNLPEEYRRTIDGESIGPKAGSCGTAAYRREQVIVEDILTDPLWDDYRADATAHGLRACWSTPVFAGDGRVIGTFAMYYKEPRTPTPAELQLAEVATHIAGIALERDEAEEALRRSEEQLRQAQKMEAVGRLAGGIAHDFNNLLTAIGGYAELLLDKVAEEHRVDLEQILDASERASALTKQLLTFTRRQTVRVERVDLNDVVADMERLLHRLTGPDVELVTDLAAGLPAVEADRSQLDQVVINLVLNARDAMPSGGKLVIATAVSDSEVELRVEDSGTGIEEDVLPHVFEPFFTTKDIGRGTGLGLATVHGIIEQAGGRIDIGSRVGEGTRVEIFLPAL